MKSAVLETEFHATSSGGNILNVSRNLFSPSSGSTAMKIVAAKKVD